MIRLAFAMAFAAVMATAAGNTSAQTLVERGGYLVNSIMACDGCHTPREKGEFVMAKRFSGGSQLWDTPAYTVRGSNITPDRDTGIGAWSDDEVKHAIRDGIHRHGRPIAPQMPFPFYKILTERDLDAIVAYLRTVPPVRNKVQDPVYRAAMPVEQVPGATKPFTGDDLRDPLKRGFYLGTIGHCMECHGRGPDRNPDYENRWGKGGFVFKETWGTAVTPNITSHPKSGIGAWTDAEIRRALTQGVSRDGRAFKPPMARQAYFSRMTEADLDALVAWIRTIPPLE